jgi:hypothetical protein
VTLPWLRAAFSRRNSQATLRRILSRARQDALDQSRVNIVCALAAKLAEFRFALRSEAISRIFCVRADRIAAVRAAWLIFADLRGGFDAAAIALLEFTESGHLTRLRGRRVFLLGPGLSQCS